MIIIIIIIIISYYYSYCFRLSGATLYTKFGSLTAALQYAFPEISWDLGKFSVRGIMKKSAQRWLRVVMAQLLPEAEILEDFQHPELLWGMSAFGSFRILVFIVLFSF
jgi:hypothetical protein